MSEFLGGRLTGDGRWFRRLNDDGTYKPGLYSVETAWKFGSHGPNIGFWIENGEGYSSVKTIYIGFFLGRVWVSWNTGRKNKNPERRWGADIGRTAIQLWWRHCEYDYKDPGYSKFVNWPCWFGDVLFGKTIYLCDRQDQSYNVIKTTIPMPEGDYPCVMVKETSVWMRPRSPFRKIRYGIDIDIPIGIPFSGKGENSWDMGEDGLYGCGISGKSKAQGWDIDRARQHARESALRTRRDRDGIEGWAMTPDDRQRQINERKEAQSE